MLTLDSTPKPFQDLQQRLVEINDIEAAASVLYWDQATYMPPEGAEARGRQLATLHQIAHNKFTDPSLGELLEKLEPYAQALPYESVEASLIRVTQRNFQRAVKVPGTFTARLAVHQAASYEAWAKARQANDFSLVQSALEKTLELSREYANFFPGYQHIADPLIADSDYGMSTETVRILFAELRSRLVPIVAAIAAQPPADASCLHHHFPEADQLAFSHQVIEKLGYDFERGRQDKTLHPFMTKFSTGDVRITTRIREDDLNEGLFSTVHETGHALYEQGISRAFEATPLAEGTSSGVHESQSRLWENFVGRSLNFWEFFYPQLCQIFPEQLAGVSLDQFYRAINKVERSLIRTDADEVTYNLHVMIRFDLELAMLEGNLAIQDLPEAWNERYRSDLGVTPSTPLEGILQDVHWYGGNIGGMFQGYTLGNLMSAQFFAAAVNANPNIPEHISQGQFDPLRDWLTENLYQYGSQFTAAEILKRVTGKDLSIEPFMDYIQQKFGTLYSL